MAPVHLITSSDDFLLEEQVRETARAASEGFGGVEPEVLPSEITPSDLATELCSPSLFAPQRVFVLPDLRTWVGAPAKGKAKKSADEPVDVSPVVGVLEEGLSPDIALVMGAWCKSSPKGPLVKAVGKAGTFEWLPGPDEVKPWEDLELSEQQEKVLRGVLARTAGEVKFSDGAAKLLMHRLGYEPRLLIQEAKKLVAARVDDTVDEHLVRALCFPKERSLEAVRDAVFDRTAAPVLDLLAALEAGVPVRNWQGQLMDEGNVPFMIVGQVGSLYQQMLYLRRLAVRIGIEHELAPERTAEPKWYPYRFKNGVGPDLLEHLKTDAPSPMFETGRRPPSLFNLGNVFKGASRWRDDDLVDALAAFGEMEAGLRGAMSIQGLSVWLTRALGGARA